MRLKMTPKSLPGQARQAGCSGFNRRFTRLTLGYSKKIENLRHSVALFVCYWNFCWRHTTTRQSPALAAGLADHVWTIEELLSKIAATE
jgi:hypothetical protein